MASEQGRAGVKQHRFSALITLNPAAGETSVRGRLGRLHTCCLVEPCHGTYFPAVISLDEHCAARAGIPAVLSSALATGEAGAFLAPGQRFTIWADAVVGHAVQADRLIGHGVIACHLSFPPLAFDGLAEGETAGAVSGRSLAVQRILPAHAHGQRQAV
jgi:hypothetical protein